MTINNNPMNPIPLWSSKDYWQCRQRTFHDAMAWPVLPTKKLPMIAVTVKGDMPSAAANTCNAIVSQCSNGLYNRNYRGNSSNYSGTSNITLTGFANKGESPVPNPMPALVFTYTSNNKYTLKLGGYNVKRTADDATEFLRTELTNGGSFYITISSTKYTFVLSDVDINYHGNKGITIAVRKFNDDSSVYSTNATLALDGCLPYYDANRIAQGWLGGYDITGTYTDGVYYIDVTVDNVVHYYSEPFMWLTNVSAYTLVTYRRSQPILTTDNYMVFSWRNGTDRSLYMYMPNVLQKSQFKFEEDVVEIDGRKYAEKQVSYNEDRIAFHCYEAYRDAIRLLWHCDIRYVGGRRIDYMEQPDMDWNSDNHLCDVVLLFQRDTIVQTNGVASAYIDSSDSSHTSYDASFDASFA